MKRIAVLTCVIVCFSFVAQTESALLSVQTDPGAQRFKESKATADFFPLANQFESQTNRLFCGPTTLAIVLNAMRIDQLKDGTLKVSPDESLLDKLSRKYLDPKNQYLFNRYTQNNVFDLSNDKSAHLKTKWQALNEPMPETKKSDAGLQLRQLHALFLAHGVKSELRVVDDKIAPETIRKEIIQNLGRSGDYVVVNYYRPALGQIGGGHISPIAAYHAKSDSVLILDVNPNNASWVWVLFQEMINAMKTADTIENRGYLLVSQ